MGVVDLQGGKAVHGIAGRRDHYRSLDLLCPKNSGIDGTPTSLIDWYRRFGIRDFYLADLDALTGGEPQVAAIGSLLSQSQCESERWLIDIGFREETWNSQAVWMQSMTARFANVAWVITSESAKSDALLDSVAEHLDPQSLVLGVDFRDGEFVGPDSGADAWIRTGARLGFTEAIVLDVAAVGTARGPATAKFCSDWHQHSPNWRLISGGGCRNVRDVSVFLQAGCQGCLIASALLPLFNANSD